MANAVDTKKTIEVQLFEGLTWKNNVKEINSKKKYFEERKNQKIVAKGHDNILIKQEDGFVIGIRKDNVEKVVKKWNTEETKEKLEQEKNILLKKLKLKELKANKELKEKLRQGKNEMLKKMNLKQLKSDKKLKTDR